jgi:hypothetical protein
MLAFFRHHRGAFLIILTVVIIISFTFMGGYTRSGGNTGAPTDRAFAIYGREYTIAEMQRTQRLFELSRMLGMYQFGLELVMASYQHQTRDSSPVDFTFHLLVLKKKMKDLGIEPSDAEAMEGLQKLQAFQKEGQFDAAQAAIVEENLGAYGFRSADLLELVKYDIGFRKLKELITKNYTPSALAAEKRYASMYQTIKASTIAFSLEQFKKDAKVDDEEVKKTYEEKKDSYKTAEKRAISYVFFEKPADLEKIEDEAERNKKTADFTETVRTFYSETDKPDAKLAALAAAQKLKVETTELFAEDAPPEALKEIESLVSAAFDLDATEQPISDPVQTEKGYYFAELIKVEEPKQQELAEVQEKIRESLIEQKAKEAMATSVNDTREALAAALKEGKKLEDIAKEKNLTLSPLPEFSPNMPPADLANAYDIAKEAEGAAAGGVTKPIPTENGVLLVVVNEKELRKREEGDTTREGVQTSLTTNEREQVFRAWFGRQKEEANLKFELKIG